MHVLLLLHAYTMPSTSREDEKKVENNEQLFTQNNRPGNYHRINIMILKACRKLTKLFRTMAEYQRANEFSRNALIGSL